jgi:hypothetical protein
VAVLGQHRVGLRDDVPILLISGEVVDLLGDQTVDDLAVGRLDETERIDPCIRGQRADEPDIRALRLIAATTGRMLIRVCGVMASTS